MKENHKKVIKLEYPDIQDYIDDVVSKVGREHVEERIAQILEHEKANPDNPDKIFAFDVIYDVAYLKGKDAIIDFFKRFTESEENILNAPVWSVVEENSDLRNESPISRGFASFEIVLMLADNSFEDVEMETVVTFGKNGNKQWLTFKLYGLDSHELYAQHSIMLG